MTVVATPLAILADEHLIDFLAWMPGVPSLISTGLIPLALVCAGVWGFYAIMRRMFAPSKHEAVQTLFVFFLAAFIILTVTGIWFRGPGMELIWPLGK